MSHSISQPHTSQLATPGRPAAAAAAGITATQRYSGARAMLCYTSIYTWLGTGGIGSFLHQLHCLARPSAARRAIVASSRAFTWAEASERVAVCSTGGKRNADAQASIAMVQQGSGLLPSARVEGETAAKAAGEAEAEAEAAGVRGSAGRNQVRLFG